MRPACRQAKPVARQCAEACNKKTKTGIWIFWATTTGNLPEAYWSRWTRNKVHIKTIGVASLDELINKTVPSSIRLQQPLNTAGPLVNLNTYSELKQTASLNKVCKSYISQGYYNTIVPSVILSTVFENPGWYTSTRLTRPRSHRDVWKVCSAFKPWWNDINRTAITNASLLDETTFAAAAEAMTMFFNHKNKNTDAVTAPSFLWMKIFCANKGCTGNPCRPVHIELVVGDYKTAALDESYFGAIVQYPSNRGGGRLPQFIEKAHAVNAPVIMAADLLALALLTPPGELGADGHWRCSVWVCRWDFGGPHAAYAT